MAKEYDGRSRPLRDSAGRLLPELWSPTKLVAVDVVDRGDATGSLLGVPETVDVLRARWEARKLAASVLLTDEDDLLRLRWRNTKRKAGVY